MSFCFQKLLAERVLTFALAPGQTQLDGWPSRLSHGAILEPRSGGECSCSLSWSTKSDSPFPSTEPSRRPRVPSRPNQARPNRSLRCQGFDRREDVAVSGSLSFVSSGWLTYRSLFFSLCSIQKKKMGTSSEAFLSLLGISLIPLHLLADLAA